MQCCFILVLSGSLLQLIVQLYNEALVIKASLASIALIAVAVLFIPFLVLLLNQIVKRRHKSYIKKYLNKDLENYINEDGSISRHIQDLRRNLRYLKPTYDSENSYSKSKIEKDLLEELKNPR